MIQFQYLVFLQSVFPPETFSTEATFVRSFASVCHHMLPEFKPDQMMKYATRLILTLRYGNIEPNEKRMLLGYYRWPSNQVTLIGGSNSNAVFPLVKIFLSRMTIYGSN